MFHGAYQEYDFTNSALDSQYHIDETKVHRFTVESQTPEETEPVTIEALYVGDFAQLQSDTILLYLHGNAPGMQSFWEVTAELANLGGAHRYGVAIYDYRGFGQSEGVTKDAATMAADLDAILEWLEDQGVTADRLVYIANSLGSLPAGPAAAGEARIPVKKLVWEVPQSSADAIIQDATGLSLSASFMTSYTFDLKSDLENYTGELLWMHGTEDETAPIENARACVDACAGSYIVKKEYDGIGHDLRWGIGRTEWDGQILDFILH